MNGLQLIDPGVTEAGRWHALVASAPTSREGHVWAAVGRKTGSRRMPERRLAPGPGQGLDAGTFSFGIINGG